MKSILFTYTHWRVFFSSITIVYFPVKGNKVLGELEDNGLFYSRLWKKINPFVMSENCQSMFLSRKTFFYSFNSKRGKKKPKIHLKQNHIVLPSVAAVSKASGDGAFSKLTTIRLLFDYCAFCGPEKQLGGGLFISAILYVNKPLFSTPPPKKKKLCLSFLLPRFSFEALMSISFLTPSFFFFNKKRE